MKLFYATMNLEEKREGYIPQYRTVETQKRTDEAILCYYESRREKKRLHSTVLTIVLFMYVHMNWWFSWHLLCCSSLELYCSLFVLVLLSSSWLCFCRRRRSRSRSRSRSLSIFVDPCREPWRSICRCRWSYLDFDVLVRKKEETNSWLPSTFSFSVHRCEKTRAETRNDQELERRRL